MSAPSAPRWRPRGIVALLLVLLHAAAGCSDLLQDPFQYGRVDVTALRRSGEGIEGVAFVLYSGTRHLGFATTDAAGAAHFDLVPFGNLAVVAAPLDGFLPFDPANGLSAPFRMDEGAHHSLEFTFLKVGPGSVQVRLRDDEGETVAGLPVELFSPNQVVASETSDSEGRVRFDDIPFGEYGVRVYSAPGYVAPGGSVYETFLIEDGSEEEVNLLLGRCAVSVNVRTTTPDGSPLPGIPFVLYVSTHVIENSVTDVTGQRTYSGLPCRGYGVRIAPPSGYTLVSPAADYVDGNLPTHRAELNATFVLTPP